MRGCAPGCLMLMLFVHREARDFNGCLFIAVCTAVFIADACISAAWNRILLWSYVRDSGTSLSKKRRDQRPARRMVIKLSCVWVRAGFRIINLLVISCFCSFGVYDVDGSTQRGRQLVQQYVRDTSDNAVPRKASTALPLLLFYSIPRSRPRGRYLGGFTICTRPHPSPEFRCWVFHAPFPLPRLSTPSHPVQERATTAAVNYILGVRQSGIRALFPGRMDG